MFKTKLLFIALIISIALSGCGRATPQPLPSPRPLPTHQQISDLAGAWMVSLQLSGGFAGLSQSIDISSDGTAVAKNERSNKTVKRQLTSDELSQLMTLVKSASLKSPGGGLPVCVDCFNYNIQINSDGGKFTAQFDDVSLPDSGMSSLVKYLRELMDKTLASG